MQSDKLRAYAKQVKAEDFTLDRTLLAKVVGVSFEGRQDLLAIMDDSTLVKLERDRRNEYDFYAVKVLAELKGAWQHVGFIPKKMSRKISDTLDKGAKLSCKVHRLTGGTTCKHTGKEFNYGLEISITPEL